MTSFSRLLFAASFSSALLLTGCSADFGPSPVQSPVGMIQGRVHGGQPAVSGAHVYLLQTNSGTYAGPGIAASAANASVSLLTNTGYKDSIGSYVLTDVNGVFSFSDSYTCTAGSVVYLYALGGNAGGGTNNSIGMLAVLGICPSGSNLAATVPFAWMNEITTVAAAYSLAGFATDATHISTGSTTLAATGIQNAGSSSGNLVNIPTGASLATTPNGNGTVPQTKIDTLANILAACVNSTDAAFANCTTLFGAATGADSSATTPTDTATAAINIAHAPAVNVSTLYGLQAGVAVPFQPALTAQPNDFTLTVSYTGGGLVTEKYSDMPNSVAVDGSGNVWLANYTPGTVSKFSTLGVPVGPTSTTGYTSGTGTFAMAIDIAGNAWAVNYGGSTLTEITPTGTVTSAIKPTNLASPTNLAFDGSGNMFLSEGGSILLEASSTAAYIAKTTAAQNGIGFPYGVAVEPGAAGGVWAGSGNTKYVGYFTNALASSAQFAFTSSTGYSSGVAVDASGNAWVGGVNTKANNALEEITTAGVGTAFTPGIGNYYIQEYSAVAMDGANTVWTSDQDMGVIYRVNASTGATMSGSFGYAPPGNTPGATSAVIVVAAEPQGLAVDGAGNVWFNSTSVANLYEMVGAAAPVATPIAYATAKSLQGQRP